MIYARLTTLIQQRRPAHQPEQAINQEGNMIKSTPTPLYRLPNGLSICQANPTETASLFNQIYVDRLYFQNGITLPADSVVIDGGANIGLFTMYVLEHYRAAKVVAVEPAPETFRLLQRNLSQYETAIAYNCALGREDGTLPFTYFPNVTCASGIYDRQELERFESVARSMILSSNNTPAALRGPEGRELLDYLLEERLKRETIFVPVFSLSTLLDDAELQHINLLKLDIEGKEYDALHGLQHRHWDKIDQLVIEVHNSQITLPLLEQLLRGRDFSVISELGEGLQAQAHKAMIYAKRTREKP